MNPAKGLAVSLLALLPVVRAEQTIVRYLDLPPDAQPQVIAADSAGNLFIGATIYTAAGRQQVRVLKTGPDGQTLATMDLDMSGITDATVTPRGTLVIAGSTSSANFPLVSPVLPNAGPNAGLVVEMDTQLRNILFSTRVGGRTAAPPATNGGTYIRGLATDPAGNLFVTGSTVDTDFPVTPGAFQTQPPKPSSFGLGSASFAFLTEISADRKRLVFSTYFGDDAVTCFGGSHCIGVTAHTSAAGVGLDPAGNVIIAGTTTANHLPVTPGTYASDCKCNSDLPAGFAASFAPGGSTLRWATYVPLGGISFMRVGISSMAVDLAGNVVLTGTAAGGFETTAGTVQPKSPNDANPAGFVAVLGSGGQRLLYSTYFGSGGNAQLASLALDPSGSMWVTGTAAPETLPLVSIPRLGPTYVASLSSDLARVKTLLTAPAGSAGAAIVVGSGATVALGSANTLLVTTAATGPSLVGIANSAASQTSRVVTPFELVSLYGIGIGPATEMGAQVVDGVVTNTLGGVQVLFDGTPAPLLYAGPNQINAVVPEKVNLRDTATVEIVTPAGLLQGPVMPVRQTDPAVFLVTGSQQMAAALNENGSLNSEGNPAMPGSIVSVWATGAGMAWYAKSDGAVITEPDPVAFPVSVLVNSFSSSTSLEVLYAGGAPGLVAGVVQVNFRLPQRATLQGITYQLQIGTAVSPPFSVYAQ